jgi:hypothetical protein
MSLSPDLILRAMLRGMPLDASSGGSLLVGAALIVRTLVGMMFTVSTRPSPRTEEGPV